MSLAVVVGYDLAEFQQMQETSLPQEIPVICNSELVEAFYDFGVWHHCCCFIGIKQIPFFVENISQKANNNQF